ncbi:phage tail tape measure protein [Spirosoma sp.]|uniref:phage tail tape measure protein n=1 Tax=Spirosoma sp. TaxID=1899569 RepID=UPI002630DC3D|nr:phage tail tape measure protein [Spirosoma sp.]MCX6216509.1 phage tail tape measure protein [Spirosoma sp.]
MANSSSDRAVIDLVINGQQAQTSLKQVSLEVTRATAAIVKMKETDAGYNDKLKELHALLAAQRQMRAQINDTSTAWGRFKSNVASTAVGVLGGNIFGSALQSAVSAIPAAIGRYREFTSASADMSANLGLAAKDVDYFNAKAREMGPTLGKSASEVLEGFKLVGSANSDLVKTPELLADVTRQAITLSQASKMTLADATASLVGSMNQFDAGADQAQRFINVMAGGAQVGSAEISDMANSLKASGIVANQTGLSFEQTNGALQSLSKESLKGEQAGTMLRNILLTLGAGANETNPKVVGLDKALDNLAKQNLSTAEITKLFGKENVTAALSLINHRDRVAEFTKGLTGTTAAYDMAAKNNATLDHQLELFSAQVDKAALWLGTKLVPAFTQVVKGGSDFLTLLPQLGSWLAKNGEWLLITGIPSLIAYNGTLIKATASAAANTIAEGYRRAAYQAGFTWLVISEAATKAYALATGVLTGQISLQTAVVTIARTVWAGFSAILLANPIGLVVGALGGLVAAMKYFSEHTQRALDLERKKSALQQQGLKDTQSNARALEDLNTKVANANNLSQTEQANLKKTIALKQLEARARLQNALAKAREIARQEAEPTFWQGVKSGAGALLTGNLGALGNLDEQKKQQTEANKAAAYAQAKQLANVEQLQADLAQLDKLGSQAGKSPDLKSPAGSGGGLTDEQKKAAKKAATEAAQDARQLEKMLADARMDALKAEQSDYDKAVFAFAEKYAKMYELAGTNTKKIKEIETLSLVEMSAIEKKFGEEELKKTYELNAAKLAEFKKAAETKLDLEVQGGSKTRLQADAEKLRLEEQYLDASELLNRAYYKTLEELNQGSAEKLGKINADKQAALLKIAQDRLDNSNQKKENKRTPVDALLEKDLADLQLKHDQELTQIKKKARQGLLTETEAHNQELSIEQRFLLEKRRLYETHYDVLSKLGVLSAEEQTNLQRQKNRELQDIDNQLLDSEQQQYEGRLGSLLKFLDEKQQYMNDAVTILQGIFKVDQQKLDVGPLLDELDQLQHKTKLTSGEQDRMKTIIAQVGKVMPDAVSGTDAYGNAIAINTGKAREEVEAQKKRANLMQKIMLAEKAWALASVGISYGQALMAAIKSAIGLPFPANLGAVASAMAIPTLNLGVATTKILGSKIDAPAFADGGFTGSGDGPAGFINDPTLFTMGQRKFIAGEAGREFVISNKALQNPVVADFARMMDIAQKTGNYGMLGSSSNGASGGSQMITGGNSAGGSMSDELGMAMLQQLQRNNELLAQYAQRPISFDLFAFQRKQQEVEFVQNATKG